MLHPAPCGEGGVARAASFGHPPNPTGMPSRLRLRGAIILGALLTGAVVILLLVRFAAQVHAFRALHAEGPAWGFPSRIYSDAVPLVAGLMPTPYLEAELGARGYVRTAAPPPRPGTWARTSGGAEVFVRGFPDAPDPAGQGGPERVRLWLTDTAIVQVRRYGGAEGAPAPDAAHPPRLEPVLMSVMLGGQNVRRTWVALDRIPQSVRDAIVTSEDRRFYGHFGVDVRAWLRALFTNVRAGDIRQGASTITQQLARGLFLGRERTFTRKLREAGLAVGLEILLSKRQILEMYLNSVYFGQAGATGIGGVAEAARWYFDLPVDSLRVEHGALLAALIPAPNLADPFVHPDVARARRDLVLREMVATGRLRASDAAIAAARPLGLRRGPPPPQRFASYGGWVRTVLAGKLPKNAATSWGLSIFTTMDLAWQQQAEEGLREGLGRVENGIGRRGLQGAFVVLDAQTGYVRVMVGGRDPDPGEFNRAFQAHRQTGSAIKPIVYATAFEGSSAGRFTPATTVPDEPREFGTGRDAWKPQNAAGSYHESVTLAQALALSLNVATANLVEAISPFAVADAAEKYGLGRMKAVPSIGLGTNEVTPLALTSAFGVFAAGGMRRDPTPLRAVVDARGRAVEAAPAAGEQVIPEGLAALMTGLLEDVVRYGVARPLVAWYGFDRPVAGKTGTTNDFLDAWFVGFTPLVTAGVWVGFDRPSSLGGPATHAAIPVWAGIMNRLLAGFPPTPFPTDTELEWANIEPWTGMLADSTCEAMRVPFLPGTSPSMPCSGASMYALESDSLAREDSVRFAEPEGGSVDTLPMRPEPVPTRDLGPSVPDTAWSDTIQVERPDRRDRPR